MMVVYLKLCARGLGSKHNILPRHHNSNFMSSPQFKDSLFCELKIRKPQKFLVASKLFQPLLHGLIYLLLFFFGTKSSSAKEKMHFFHVACLECGCADLYM